MTETCHFCKGVNGKHKDHCTMPLHVMTDPDNQYTAPPPMKKVWHVHEDISQGVLAHYMNGLTSEHGHDILSVHPVIQGKYSFWIIISATWERKEPSS